MGGLTHHGFLMGTLMQNLVYLINIIPDTANLKTTAKRIVELAVMAEKAKDRKSFYQMSGHHELEYHENPDPNAPALEISNLRMFHRKQSADVKPFVKVDYLRVEQGDRVYIKGASGCGKTSLLKAACGLWGYGEGIIVQAKNLKCIYAEQSIDAPYNTSLLEQVKHGVHSVEGLDSQTEELKIMSALKASGLLQQLGYDQKTDEELKTILHASTNQGQHWCDTLSGGQRQRLMLARLIYQQPDLILLDEPTSALDKNSDDSNEVRRTDAQSVYFETLARECPGATILVIMHDESVIDSRLSFFNKILKFSKPGELPVMMDLQKLLPPAPMVQQAQALSFEI